MTVKTFAEVFLDERFTVDNQTGEIFTKITTQHGYSPVTTVTTYFDPTTIVDTQKISNNG